MNGPIGKQMVDTLVESSGNVEVSYDILDVVVFKVWVLVLQIFKK